MALPPPQLVLLSLLVALAGAGWVVGRLRMEERRLRSRKVVLDELFASSDEAAVLVDGEGTIVRANDAFHRIFDLPVDDAAGRRLEDFLEDRDGDAAGRGDAAWLLSAVRGEPVHRGARCVHGGERADVTVVGGPVRIPGDRSRAFFVLRDAEGHPLGPTREDMTQRKAAERALRESEERYALALRGTRDGLWDWNLDSGEVFYSNRWLEMLGVEGEEVAHTLDAWLERVDPDHRPDLQSTLAAHGENRTERFQHEHRIRHRDGHWLWVLARGIAERDPEGRPYRITGVLTDITDRKEAEEQLAQGALYDPLTGLPNRAFLNDLLGRAMLRAQRRPDYTFGLLFLDLDRFKRVNDALGHQAGDEVLVEVAARLEKCVRPGDVVTRLGGDEFCVLVDDITEDRDATRVARRVLEVLHRPFRIGDRVVRTGVTVGIALREPGMKDAAELVRNADTAMYRGKAAGKGRIELYDRSMHDRAVTLLKLETDLRRGLEEGQFRLVYQPVVRLRDRVVIGFEALVRWQHPDRGLVSPGVFVPVAEETGVIVPLGWWILDEACMRMSDWARRFPSMNGMGVCVNLSSKQLRQPDLVERVQGALSRAHLDPTRLRLDVNERVLMEEPEWNASVLGRLRRLGVQVQVDDFGSGTSSLSYLSRFPISSLKIDPSFVRGTEATGTEDAVLQAFITLARRLGIHVVAEGVETDDQGARLLTLECDHGQGYLYSHPLAEEDVGRLLERQFGPPPP